MKKMYALLFLLGIINPVNLTAQVCTPAYSSGCSLDAIQYFSLKGEPGSVIYNSTGACTASYNDYTGTFTPVIMSRLLSYSGFMRTQDPNNYVSIWIDVNDNNLFESTERLLNNLQIGNTNVLYSIFIPSTFNLGTHRMRVRNVYYGAAPSTPTDPCLNYTYGETEDYLVTIINAPAPRYAAPGVAGTCTQSSRTTIDAASNNTTLVNIALVDSNNNHFVGLYPNGNSFGTVYASTYVHSGATRQAPNGNYYLNRNITITPSQNPTGSFNLRMYYLNAELNNLIAEPGSGVTSVFDLTQYRNTDLCQSALTDQNGQQIFPTGFGSISGDRFLDLTNVSQTGTFYFSGQNLAANCLTPTNINITLNSFTSASINWTAPSGSPTGYQWEVTTTGSPSGSPNFTTLLSATVNSLTPNSLYYLHIRTVCGSSYSNWVTISFNSVYNDNPCNATVLTAGSAVICQNTLNATANTDPSIACSAPNNTVWYKFTPSATGTYQFRTSIPAVGDPLNGWLVFFSASGTCPGSLTLNQMPVNTCYEFGQTGNNDVDTILSPTLTAGVTYYLMIDGFSGDIGEFCIQVLTPGPPVPSCTSNISPANGLGNVSPINTLLSWNSVAGATSYDIYLGNTNPPVTFLTNTNSTSFNISLNYNETYSWYIVPRNSQGPAIGCQTNSTSFTTSNPGFCTPVYVSGCSNGDSLSYFSLKGEGGTVIYNQTGNSCSAAPSLGYSNFTSLFSPVNLSIGESYSGFIRTGGSNDYISIWIDDNDNGYFENDERVLNNLQAGNFKSLYSIYIPITTTLGIHRIRIRNVYYATPPTAPTHPCNVYARGETEDYRVNITNVPGIRSTATGVLNLCINSSATTIDQFSNNHTADGVKLLDSLNNYVLSIYADGNEMGRVSANYFVRTGSPRLSPQGFYYLNRNIHTQVAQQPSTPFRLRTYFRTTELNSLIAQAGSGVSNIFDLSVIQNTDLCSSAISSGFLSSVLPTGFVNFGGNSHALDLTNLSSLNAIYFSKYCVPVVQNESRSICGSSYIWNGNTYTTSGTYTASYLNSAGCDSIIHLQLTLVPLGPPSNAYASPLNLCTGSATTLSYASCSAQAGFQGYYTPFQWFSNSFGNNNGYISGAFAPDSILMVSSNGLSGSGSASWSIIIPCNGFVQFDWSYTTTDGSQYDYPMYSINGGIPQTLPGYNQFGSPNQNGTASISVNQGDNFELIIYSTDNLFGACSTVIRNFMAPVTGGFVSVNWFDAPTAGNLLGNGTSISYTPPSSGTYTYYAEVQDLLSGCTYPNRISIDNPVVVNPCGINLDVQLYLQGYYNAFGLMRPVLFNQGVSVLATITDTMYFYLVDPFTLAVVDSASGILSTSGIVSLTFTNIGSGGSYYLVAKHRNTIETWSSTLVFMDPLLTNFYSFASMSSAAYGSNQASNGDGTFSLFSGDLNQDDNIDLLDASLLEADINNFLFGYYGSDINGDGNVDLLDAPILEGNISNFIFSQHP